ncbi:MAG: YegS/Rv2252/BmrU family lipid kinase [Bacteroidota bacterium]|nr:YegS/Rv2252/BmrU family lipid kinase [Bacteroidota bacterium]
MQNNNTILFVINPISGGKVKTDWEQGIKDSFANLPQAIEFYIQTGQGDKVMIEKQIANLKPDKVVAVGGDGTVKLVAGIIKETTIKLGIIPAGSANGLAKELGIPEDLQTAIKIVLEGECRKLDAIRINEEELCFHLSDVGLNALLVKYFEASDTRGMWGYARSLFKMIWNKRQMRVTIEADGEIIKRKAFMVALANAEKYGTGAVINPGGSVFDGVFEIVVVRKIKLKEVIKAVMAHRSFNSQNIEVIKAKSVNINFQQKAPFQIDGEYMGKTANISARILPGILWVMLPKEVK